MAELTPSTPASEDLITRSSFRDDATVQVIAERLAGDTPYLRVLDCGCQDGRLAKAMIAAQLDLSRICYFGVEMDVQHLNAVRAARRRGAFDDYREFDVRLRETTELAGYEAGAFDFIVVNNLLHELPAEQIPRALLRFNELLRVVDGRLIIIDMEELPAEDFEPWALTWNVEEVKRMLIGGGFSPYVSSYRKRVRVHRVATGSAANGVDTRGIADVLREVLVEKKKRVLAEAADQRASRSASREALLCSCKLASIELSLHQLKVEVSNEIFSESDTAPVGGRRAVAGADL